MSSRRRAVVAQLRVELLLTLRRGESVLLTFAIPVLLLAFFTLVDVVPVPDGFAERVDFLAPGVLSLAVMSTAMVSLAIATGFERQTGVLKRLGAMPLSRPGLLAAKIGAIGVLEAAQVLVLVIEAWLLGWAPEGPGLVVAIVAMLVATVAFAGLGMIMAGRLAALTTLALANGLYLILLLLGGMVIPLEQLPTAVATAARATPAGALSEITRTALGAGSAGSGPWVVLVIWAVAAPLVAARVFRWD